MRLSGTCRLAALATVVAAAPATILGCGSDSLSSDGGKDVGPVITDPNFLSDFEEGKAIVLPYGDPVRNGAWYSYNDTSATCLQSPAHGGAYYASEPVVRAPGPSGGRALHASFSQCVVWGAGVGADLSSPLTSDSGVPARPRMPYDVSGYTGVTFWAMAEPGTGVHLRAKMVMRISTQIEDGGVCDESVLGPDRCGDEWSEVVTLPSDGTWKSFTMRFTDAAFKPEGWGQPFAWNPADVFGIQFQSVDIGALYDFWIDDVALLR